MTIRKGQAESKESGNVKADAIICGDCLSVLGSLPDGCVNCCVTSPPYYGLRDYGMEGQIGREDRPEEYIRKLAGVFAEVFRVLKDDGTLWLNIADVYCNKELAGIPWMLAFALRKGGWRLRNDIIWQKGNAMPESAKDRLTRSYEHIFLFAKSQKYYFDARAIAVPIAESTAKRYMGKRGGKAKYANEVPGQANVQGINKPRAAGTVKESDISPVRNCRDVWLINTASYHGMHFAAYPPKLAERCILAGCPEGGIVLDPFFGSGTTGLAAVQNNRRYIGIELNGEYCSLAEKRIREEGGKG